MNNVKRSAEDWQAYYDRQVQISRAWHREQDMRSMEWRDSRIKHTKGVMENGK